jgi:hypothetical protein
VNARIIVGHAAIEDKARALDASFIRRVRSASLHELRLIKRAHLLVGCEFVFDSEDIGCWRCALIGKHER